RCDAGEGEKVRLTAAPRFLHSSAGSVCSSSHGGTMPDTPGTLQQAAAIPVRMGQVCLVTSRSGKRWVIPKGCLEPGKTAGEIALQEAWEEAGIVGVLQPDPVGSYLYDKAGITCHVLVFVLQVTQLCDRWPEDGFRE